MSSKKVLVTGGAGLIGSHLVDLLLQEGHTITILDNLEPQTHPHGKPDWIPNRQDVRFIHGDMRSEKDVLEALKGAEWVFHQAAFGGFTTALTQYIDVNSTGTARIFELIREHKLPVEKMVMASSQAVYGEGVYSCLEHGPQYPAMRSREQLMHSQWESRCVQCERPMLPGLTPETAPLRGETIYAISKLAEERLCIGMGKQLGIPTVALRYAVTYGPRQSIFNPYTGVVSIFSTRLLNDLKPVLYEDGEQTRDFLYVADNAAANLFVMQCPETAYQVYNVGTQTPTRMVDLVSTLATLYEKPLEADFPGSFRPGDVRHFVHDSSSLYQLGWQPAVSLEQGLSHYVEWIRAQGSVKEYFESAMQRLEEMQVVIAPHKVATS